MSSTTATLTTPKTADRVWQLIGGFGTAVHQGAGSARAAGCAL
ncbi:hypothetical protein [Streptomyces brevispora]|uniref:Uncharacterized protein n=1 Tax=Streptomyces brevispora TaxID=887462 RepID=A0A561TY94_9ACTN|nr:hypothetical protein [Streptomyces brevispora]TWF92087.1 hypothetical protein FHX80_12406 [Streptomyces brevispora]WSC17508.1 hypothetical protein OIE64_34985 [Streptomyces brevispora]